jgi:pimeloyl-ACP methyl ester carboxylesterase
MTGDLPGWLCVDPPVDPEYPPQTVAHAIPSGGLNLNALFYSAAGLGPHPTVLLLHGLPGNEQNNDLAQSIRRSGWNVLTIHYRGSWGTPGTFTFANCLEDAAAAIEWLRGKAIEDDLRIDAGRIAIVGHSMGGFVAAHTAAAAADLLGAALISGVDLGMAFGRPEQGRAGVDDNVGFTAGLHILQGTSAKSLAEEARANADWWRLANYAARLAARPMLLVTADDGFADGSDALADAIHALQGALVSREHFPTDHSYSDHRIRLQARVLDWLGEVDQTL